MAGRVTWLGTAGTYLGAPLLSRFAELREL